MITLVRVEAPHFVAGLYIEDDVCFAAAPILSGAVGRSAAYLRDVFMMREWKASIVLDKPAQPVVEAAP